MKIIKSLASITLVTCLAGAALAAPKSPFTTKVLGTRAKAPSGKGECFDVAITNRATKVVTSLNVAVYAYDKAGAQLGAKYEYETMSLAEGIKAGGTMTRCLSNSSWFPGEVASIEAVVYSTSYDDKTTWFLNIPKTKAKGAAIK